MLIWRLAGRGRTQTPLALVIACKPYRIKIGCIGSDPPREMVFVSNTPCGDPSPDPLQGRNQCERAPRTNLLLSATIEAGELKASVRIRNLSESGALLEGAAFPDVGEMLSLRRLDLEIGAIVVWRAQSRCGVKFEGKISVADWASGTYSGSSIRRDQSRVDGIQAAVRAGMPAAPPKDRSIVDPEELKGSLDGRLAEELAHVRRLLENMGDELTDDPIIVQRHSRILQGFDMACQILGHLGAILTAENRAAAVDAIGMEDLRARLLRKAIFKD